MRIHSYGFYLFNFQWISYRVTALYIYRPEHECVIPFEETAITAGKFLREGMYSVVFSRLKFTFAAHLFFLQMTCAFI
jgi:predicted N-acyltransferase